MPNCYYYDEQSNHCNCYVNENLNELLEENVNLRVQLANAMVTVRRVDERCAKLRELALEIWCSCPVSEDDCAKCPHNIDESDGVWCDIPILMDALGVEVDT